MRRPGLVVDLCRGITKITRVPAADPITSGPKSPLGMTVLVVDDEPHIRKMLAMSLSTDGHKVTSVTNAKDALTEAARQSFDLAFVDLRLGADTGMDLIPALTSQSPWLKVVVITAYASIDTAVEAMKRGASDYLPKPFTPAQVRLVVERVGRVKALEQRLAGLQGALGEAEGTIDLASASPDMCRAIDMARQVAPSEATVLICGESGTGKGVLAKAIHAWSQRSAKPFSTVSCPTLSPQLLESELFGHSKGAFTGAVRDSAGRIAACEGGTLFLDEVGDLPLEVQPKLLRFMQDRQYERVGDTVTRRADVRIITATNVDLAAAVDSGKFREDLLYRINVFQINMPPLRTRTDDILPLAERLLAFFVRPRLTEGFTNEAAAALKTYHWPGNVRELRNVVERAAILCRAGRIGIEHLPSSFVTAKPSSGSGPEDEGLVSLERLEEKHIRRVLAATHSLEQAAQILGIDAATLYRKRKKYRL